MSDSLEPVQSLWVGSLLPEVVRLSIRSFLAIGHQYHLYSYCKLIGVPEGTMLKDANEVIPASFVFKNAYHNTYAAFSDRFRYELLYQRGGWWADTDVIALRKWDIRAEFVVASQRESNGTESPVGAVLRCPAGAPIMQALRDQANQIPAEQIRWHEIGPELLQRLVHSFGYTRFIVA